MFLQFNLKGCFMFKLPLVIIYMIIAFNITAFTAILLLDMLIINSVLAKVISCTLTIGAWVLAYINRDKVVEIF
jgi:hypothetical protein